MHLWLVKAVVAVSLVALVAIPAALHPRGEARAVAEDRKGARERALLALAALGFLLPLVWLATPLLSAAERPSHPLAFASGVLCIALGLWLHWRAHADLGSNWSVTLQVRDGHQLVRHGVYRRLRHPMYAALLWFSAGLALVLPNWAAGPSYLAAIVLLVALRIRPEERLMRERFGPEYEAYAGRTKRLLPLVW